jgi:hypothetical protein
MDRVKEISKLGVRDGYVLIKLKFKSSLILKPAMREKSGPQVDYAEVIVVGATIEDIKVGDIVIDFSTTKGFEYKGEQYALVPRMNIHFFVEPNNFDFNANRGTEGKHLTN